MQHDSHQQSRKRLRLTWVVALTVFLLLHSVPSFAEPLPVTVLFDDFQGNGLGTGDATSINGGFKRFGNSAVAISEDSANSEVDMVEQTTTDNFFNGGIISSSSFDSTGPIHIRWDISNVDTFGGNASGYSLGISNDQSRAHQIRIRFHRDTELWFDGTTIFSYDPALRQQQWVEALYDDNGYDISLSSGDTFAGTWASSGVDYSQIRNPGGESFVYSYLTARSNKQPSDEQVSIDGIRVSVPEPSALSLVLLMGLIWLKRPYKS